MQTTEIFSKHSKLETEEARFVSEAHFRDLISVLPAAIYTTDLDGRITLFNEPAAQLWNRQPETGWEHWSDLFKFFQPDGTLLPVEECPISRALRDGRLVRQEIIVERHDGTRRTILEQPQPLRDHDGEMIGMVDMLLDITDQRRAREVERGQHRILQLMAEDAPLAQVLEAVVRSVERQSTHEMLGSILLLDEDGIHLRHGAAPSLPAAYNEAIEGSEIGLGVGSCGTAAFLRKPVYVTDIATDPLWARYKDLALPHGLRASWSTPIFSRHDEVLGTFAMYYRQPGGPEEDDLRLVELTTQIASIAIERHRAEQALRRSEASLRALTDNISPLS